MEQNENLNNARLDSALLDTILAHVPLGFAFFDRDLCYRRVNETLAVINGVPAEDHIGHKLLEVLPHQNPQVVQTLQEVLQSGEPQIGVEVVGETPAAPGETRYWSVAYLPVFAREENKPVGVAAIITEITDSKRSAQELREENAIVETVGNVGRRISLEMDLQRLLQTITDAATELTGAHFGAFFVNAAESAHDESYLLYALSGVPREALSQFPLPTSEALFGASFREEGVVRLDDATRDPRYAHHPFVLGLPTGDVRIRSYMAVPIVSRFGQMLGGLFFGHEKPGVFTERKERNVRALVAQAAVAIDNAHLYEEAQREIEERKRIETALRESQTQVRTFLREVLYSVSEGRLRLCATSSDLPAPLTAQTEPIPLTTRTLRTLRQHTVDVAVAQGHSAERWQDLVTAVGEAAMNAVVHGGGGYGRVFAANGIVQIRVEDSGKGIAMDRLHRATLERGYTTAGSMGHGFWMMLKTCDRVYLLTGPAGTTVVLEQERVSPEPGWLHAR